MCKVAVGVITFNHPMVVQDVLKNCIQAYYDCGIDIYYFDSSDNDETEKIVNSFMQMGYDNLYYLHYPATIGPNEKFQDILSGEHFEKEYDYIWPIKDRSYCTKETLEEILAVAMKKPDVIFLGVLSIKGKENLMTQTYDCAKAFYRDWAWMATSIDVTIFRRDTILKNWKEKIQEEKYQLEYIQPFVLYTYLFSEIAELSTVTIQLLRENSIRIINSPLGQSSWKEQTFKLWKDDWIQVNDMLPECYDEYKAEIIKQGASLPWLLGSASKLVELNEEGILTVENVETVLQDWERVSDVPAATVRAIVLGTYDRFHDLQSLNNYRSNTIEILIKLIQIVKEKNISNDQIPFEDIFNCILQELVDKRSYSQEQLNIIIGSLMDIGNTIMDKKADEKDICNGLQMLISMLLLMN